MEIAVIGMSCRVPGAADLESFWRNLVEGRRSRTDLALDDPTRVPVGYLLDGVEDFDAGLFGLTPAQAALTDPQHRLFLELCHAALENGGWDPAGFPGDIGVYGGRGMETYRWRHIFANRAVMAVSDHTTIGNGNHADALTTLVSYQLNLRGPSVGVYTACSTSLVAVHMAAEALRAAECDMALAGGVNIELPGDQGYVYRGGGTESADGDCNPFDAKATGTVAGSGGGVVLLKRLDDALADGDSVRAVILGNAVNNDGASKVGFTAASVTGQATAIANALANADVDVRSIGYVETSATGSPMGDALEVEALTSVFARSGPPQTNGGEQWCAIGSVKSNIGHLSQGAGVVGLIKTVLSLEHGLIPPTLGFTEPNPAIDFDASPFYVNATLSKWDRGDQPRRAGVSSFGIGGTNAHVILEEAPPRPPSSAPAEPVLLTVSARSARACEAAAARLAEHLGGHLGEHLLGDVAYTLRAGRVDYPHRIAVVAADPAGAAAALRSPKHRTTGVATDPPPRVVFVFRDEGPDWFTRGYEAARGWQAWGVRPATMVGHGAGELVAAAIAGVLDLAQARELAALYDAARADESALPTMAVPAAAVTDEVTLVAVNGPNAFVVAAPEERLRALSGRRLRARHPLAAPVFDARPAPPRLPFLSGRTGLPITAGQATDPAYWTSLLSAPMLIGDCLAAVAGAQVLEGRPRTLEAAGRLWTQGVPIELGLPGRRVALPGYPYERKRHWIEPDLVDTSPAPAPAPDSLEAIWRALLGHEDIGPDSDFFALGGTSLTAVQLIAQVQAAFGVRLSMRAVFDAPTVADMAETITRLQARTRASQAT